MTLKVHSDDNIRGQGILNILAGDVNKKFQMHISIRNLLGWYHKPIEVRQSQNHIGGS